MRTSRSPSLRTAWIVRPFLYAALGTVVLWNWRLHVAARIFAVDLDVEASAPCAAPTGEALLLHVVIAPMTGGCVRSDVHWRALDERGAELARGDVTCYGQTTLMVQDAARVRTVALAVRGPCGERSLRFERAGAAAGDRAATTCVAEAMDLIARARREREIALWFTCAGLVASGVWLVAELGAWLVRHIVWRRATARWQVLAAIALAIPVAASWWHLGRRLEWRDDRGWPAHTWIADLMSGVRYLRSPFE